MSLILRLGGVYETRGDSIIPVYEGDAAYPIKARLRYRISDGLLALWYELVEPEKIQEDAFRVMLEKIDEHIDDSVSIYRARA